MTLEDPLVRIFYKKDKRQYVSRKKISNFLFKFILIIFALMKQKMLISLQAVPITLMGISYTLYNVTRSLIGRLTVVYMISKGNMSPYPFEERE